MKIPLLSRIFEKREGLPLTNQKLYSFLSGGTTHSGVMLNEKSSLRIVAVYACVNLLASTIASLPLPVYQRLDRGKKKATDLDIYSLLHDQPNSEQTSFLWRQNMMAHVLLWGHGYSEIESDGNGEPIGLWPLPPWQVTTGRTKEKAIFHRVMLPEGGSKDIPDYAMLHIQALLGLSPIRQAMEAIGLAQATQDFGARLFGQGANLGGIVQHPAHLTKEAHENLEKSLNENYTGLGKAHRIMLLEEGMTWNKVGIPPEEAQFLETRKFQRGEIASLFRIPPHMIGDLEHATFSNIEHQAIEFVVHTLRPWLVNWEQEIKNKLLPDDDLFAEFLVDGLLRGDTVSRYQAYAVARQNGWMNADDIRELENMNPLPNGEGEIYLAPLNMQPLSWLTGGSSVPPAKSENLPAKQTDMRAKGSTLTRFRMTRAYQKVFENAAERIVDEEVKKVSRAVNQNLKQRSIEDFKNWLIDYYRDFPQLITRHLTPIAQSLTEAIIPLAKEQINSTTEVNTQKLVGDYINVYTKRHIESSTGQIEALLREERADELIEARLKEWKDTRPAKIGINETVQLSNFVAKAIFAAGGVTVLVWRNTSGKPCPFCQEMDGRTVGIEQNFVGADQKLEAEGKSPMTIYRPTSQPPLHEGCECIIEPG